MVKGCICTESRSLVVGHCEIDFKSKREVVMVIKRKQVKRVRKKVKMPQIEFSRKAIKEIKNRKKRMRKEMIWNEK